MDQHEIAVEIEQNGAEQPESEPRELDDDMLDGVAGGLLMRLVDIGI